jgi:hypothetical protein
MRQGKGTELLGPNDPRGSDIGIIYVAPADERKDVLTALLTQAKMNRSQVAIVLPQQQNKAFQRPQDFDALKTAIKEKKIRTEIIFIAPGGSMLADYARQRRFTVYSSPESYANAMRNARPADKDGQPGKEERKGGLFGLKRTAPTLGAAAAGAAAGAALSGSKKGDEPSPSALPPLPDLPQMQPTPEPPPNEQRSAPLRSLYVDRPTVDMSDPGSPQPTPPTARDEKKEPESAPRPSEDENEKKGPSSARGAAIAGAGAAGVAGGLLAAEAMHRDDVPDIATDDDDDDYALGPVTPKEAPASKPLTPSTPLGQNRPPASEPPETPTRETRNTPRRSSTPLGAAAAGAGAGAAAENIIELKSRTGRNPRRTNQLPESRGERDVTTTPPTSEQEKSTEPPTTTIPRTPGRRTTSPTGKGEKNGNGKNGTTEKNNRGTAIAGAAAAGVVAGALAAEAAGSPTARAATAGSSSTSASRTVNAGASASRPPVRAGSGGAATLTPRTGNTSNRRRRPPWWLILLLLLLVTFLVVGGIALSAQPQLLSNVFGTNPTSATVTITPDSKIEQHNYVVTAIPKDPSADKREVLLDKITSAPTPKTEKVTATGKGSIAATAATGTILFQNSAFTDKTIVPTRFTVGGINFITDATVTVPAGTNNGNGTVQLGDKTVAAHAETAGAAGNIGANAINSSVSDSVLASNPAAFAGGQDARSYTFLQQADIDKFATGAKEDLKKLAADGIGPKVKAGEQLVRTDCANPKVTWDQNVGDNGVNIASANVTVSATCTGLAFDYTGAQDIVHKALQQQLARDAGIQSDHYVLAGNIIMQTGLLSAEQDKLSLQMMARGIWYYKFSEQQQKDLANNIKNQDRETAQSKLAHTPGVKSVKIEIPGGDTLPSDPTQIKFVFADIPGAKQGDLPTPNATFIPPPGTTPGGGTTTPATVPPSLGK